MKLVSASGSPGRTRLPAFSQNVQSVGPFECYRYFVISMEHQHDCNCRTTHCMVPEHHQIQIVVVVALSSNRDARTYL